MITKLTLRNFKSIGEQSYEFTPFDLLIGRNNSGKSTVLQALAIWQYCLNEFHRSKRTGSTGIQIILPNFTALPLPQFNLLWKNKTDRHYPVKQGKKVQEFILIEIIAEWRDKTGKPRSFGIDLRYSSPQSIYATPSKGWASFRELEKDGCLPMIVYVPPFSGLEPTEQWRDDGPVRQQVGKAQPGSVLRNLLLRVYSPSSESMPTPAALESQEPRDWQELRTVINRLFGVELLAPKYQQGVDILITSEYKQGEKTFDIISGGSGFHQALTLLAFLYGYQPTTILFDEPDAHLHVNLQREILDYLKQKSRELGAQFLIATHAEEFINGVDAGQMISLLGSEPRRIQSKPEIIRAMAEVSNTEMMGTLASPYILYVEGESDERILRAWATVCGENETLARFHFKIMRGGAKKAMRDAADEHFAALREIVRPVQRMMLFDHDSDETAFHPREDNPSLYEWKRRNIENYLLVPEAWKRTVLRQFGISPEGDDLLAQPLLSIIDSFFSEQNLMLPSGKTWRNVGANIFQVVDGKRILFENNDSLFQALRPYHPSIQPIREHIAENMTAEEIHEDVHRFFAKLRQILSPQAKS